MNIQLKHRAATFAAIALLMASCTKQQEDTPIEPPTTKGIPVSTLSVSIDEPQPEPDTRVGVDVEANKDTYHWIAGDVITLCELNAAGTAFTGNNFDYTYEKPSGTGPNGTFKGAGAFVGRTYVPVHIRNKAKLVWPVAGAKFFEYKNNDALTQAGRWTDANVQQNFVNNLLFVGAGILLDHTKPTIVLNHTLTQVQLDVKANDAMSNNTPIKKVEPITTTSGNKHFATRLRFGLNGDFDEAGSTWGKSMPTVNVTDPNAKLNTTSAYRVRTLTRQSSAVNSAIKVRIDDYNEMVSTGNTTSKKLDVGKVYKTTHSIKVEQWIKITPISSWPNVGAKGGSTTITVTTSGASWTSDRTNTNLTMTSASGNGGPAGNRVTLRWLSHVGHNGESSTITFRTATKSVTFTTNVLGLPNVIEQGGKLWAKTDLGAGAQGPGYFGGLYNLADAKAGCRNMGPGWALPDDAELRTLGLGAWNGTGAGNGNGRWFANYQIHLSAKNNWPDDDWEDWNNGEPFGFYWGLNQDGYTPSLLAFCYSRSRILRYTGGREKRYSVRCVYRGN